MDSMVPDDAPPLSRLETVIVSRTRDLVDGFKVRRILPTARRRMVGPFIFLDQMGPEQLRGDGFGLDVAPHPHIGLSTLTWLFEGELLHRDSLGSTQLISPGQVNWMTAGSGIAHSERTPSQQRTVASALFGLQSWIALPQADEERAPSFTNYGVDDIPRIEDAGLTIRVVVGSMYGATSPVQTFSETFYIDARLESGASLPLDPLHEERAVYVINGEVRIRGELDTYSPGTLLIARPGERLTLDTAGGDGAHVMLLGGATMDGPRHIWWNFVSSSKDRIEQAKDDWRAHRFAPVIGDDDYIPLPETEQRTVVRYP